MYGRQEVSKKRQLETTQETSPPGDSASSPGKGGGAPEELRGPSWAGMLPLAQSGSLHSEVFLLGEGVPSGAQWSSVPGGPSPGNIRGAACPVASGALWEDNSVCSVSCFHFRCSNCGGDPRGQSMLSLTHVGHQEEGRPRKDHACECGVLCGSLGPQVTHP